jgi:hypothetical protein
MQTPNAPPRQASSIACADDKFVASGASLFSIFVFGFHFNVSSHM